MSDSVRDHMTGRAILVRTDASSSIGLGHAMRCLSLAEMHREAGGQAVFLMAEPPSAFAGRASSSGAEVRALTGAPGSAEDVGETLAVADALGAGWIVLDGYQFDGDFQAKLAAGGPRVLALDDHGHAGRYSADLVLNQNAGAGETPYRDRRPNTRLLLGPRFALVREEFRLWSAPRPAIPARARRVVVTFGGSDPDNVSERVLAGLGAVPGPLEILLLIGAANVRRIALQDAASRCPHPVEVVVDARDMAARLASADLAVAAAGVTALELARVGTPHIAIVLAENQRPGALAMASEQIVVNLGWHADVVAESIGAAVAALVDDAERRAEMSRRGRELVDGRGAERVLAAMGLIARPPL
jgi:UDP-2,4-diacetamido-2,4,6-trideoxy-beta-L-altropyranose hydrolase